MTFGEKQSCDQKPMQELQQYTSNDLQICKEFIDELFQRASSGGSAFWISSTKTFLIRSAKFVGILSTLQLLFQGCLSGIKHYYLGKLDQNRARGPANIPFLRGGGELLGLTGKVFWTFFFIFFFSSCFFK